MIAIYNETKNVWVKNKLNDRISKLTMNVTLNDDKKRFIDLITSNDVDYTDIAECVSMNDCKTVAAENISVKFQKKDLKPMIITSDKPAMYSDVLLISLNLNKRIVKSMQNTKAAVLNYFIASGILTMTVSIKENNNKSKFEITLHDNEDKCDITYCFTKVSEDKYMTKIIEKACEEEIEKPTYRISKFRPIKPTNLIFVPACDKEKFENAYEKYDRHTVVFLDDSDACKKMITEYKDKGYKAVTFFSNKDRERTNDDSVCYDALKENFPVFNILSNNGKVSFIK